MLFALVAHVPLLLVLREDSSGSPGEFYLLSFPPEWEHLLEETKHPA